MSQGLHTTFPAVNLVVYHGLLAPHARGRSQIVRYARPHPDCTARPVDASPRAADTPGEWTWAALMRRVSISMPSPARCGGRLRVLATVQDPRAVQAILAYLARSNTPAPPGPAPPAPAAIP
jgi:hypothetical protein